MKRRWSSDDDEYLLANYKPDNANAIGVVLDRTTASVRVRVSNLRGKSYRGGSREKYHAAIAAVCERNELSIDQAMGRRKHRELAYARFEAWAALRADGYSLSTIAKRAGRHHTTVLQGLRRWAKMQRAAE